MARTSILRKSRRLVSFPGDAAPTESAAAPGMHLKPLSLRSRFQQLQAIAEAPCNPSLKLCCVPWSIPPVGVVRAASDGADLTCVAAGCCVAPDIPTFPPGESEASRWDSSHSGSRLHRRWTRSPGFVLTAHMLQHMVLMMVAPPLILLGEPLIPSCAACRVLPRASLPGLS